MTLGIKVGPDKQSLLDLAPYPRPFGEVWFNINHTDDYNELFSELKRRKVQVGLHFWGVLDDGICANFGYPDKTILDQSVMLVKKTIDIAAQNAFQYVNIHPGNRAVVKMDLEPSGLPIHIKTNPTAPQAQAIFLEHVTILDHYAKSRNVVLTVERSPDRVQKTDWHNPKSRLHPIDSYQLPVASIQAASESGISIANDFGHTATDPASDNPQDIWKFLYDATTGACAGNPAYPFRISDPAV